MKPLCESFAQPVKHHNTFSSTEKKCFWEPSLFLWKSASEMVYFVRGRLKSFETEKFDETNFEIDVIALRATFHRTFITIASASNWRNLASYSLPVIAFFNEEVTVCINEEDLGAINEAALSAIIAPKKELPCFYCFMF